MRKVFIKSLIIIFLAEPPPPTKNLEYTKITQTEIEIAWEKPAVYEFFEIVGYKVSYKKQSESKYKTQIMTSAAFSATLSDLITDTLYDITVHGYNEEGSGDKVAIKARTKKGKCIVAYSVNSFEPKDFMIIEIAHK